MSFGTPATTRASRSLTSSIRNFSPSSVSEASSVKSAGASQPGGGDRSPTTGTTDGPQWDPVPVGGLVRRFGLRRWHAQAKAQERFCYPAPFLTWDTTIFLI